MERILAATTAVLLIVQVAVVVSRHAPGGRPTTVAIEDREPPDPLLSASTEPSPTPPSPTAPPTADPSEPTSTTDEVRAMEPGAGPPSDQPPQERIPPPADRSGSGDRAPPPRDPARARFAGDFPEHEAARQDPRDPSTTRWAVLIGINDHYGPTRDNVGSRQDAEDLYAHLMQQGWRSDHVLLLTDRTATRERVEQSIAWLTRKTDGDSVAVFHYSGHTKQWPGWDPDRDGEVPDEALWPADNDRMTDRELTDRLADVHAGRMWIDVGACEAAGYADPGMLREGRVLTFSSQESEKSYEDPSVSNSVWGYYLIERGMRSREADTNGDGDVTVQEAFDYAAPRAAQRTANGRNGPQHPLVQDQAGPFSLTIPPPPPPQEDPTDDDSQDRDDGEDDGGDDGEDDGCGLPICPGTRGGRALRR